MEYITPQEVAENWGISLRTVHAYCANEKIPGVIHVGKHFLIPKNAKRPLDQRTKTARAIKEIEPYHFPMLVYSRYYTDRMELSEDEQLLLDAQIKQLKGEYVESVKMCRMLIDRSLSESVKFGAHWNNALCFQFLGLFNEVMASMRAMATLCEKNPQHAEDYRMMMAHCSMTQSLNPKDYYAIDISKLSDDAWIAYECFSMWSSLFCATNESPYAMAVYTARCNQMGVLGIWPAHLAMHGCLSYLCALKGDVNHQMEHIRKACKIGYEQGYDSLMYKYSISAGSLFHQCMNEYGKDYAYRVEKRRDQIIKINLSFTAFITGQVPVLGESSYENEFIYLLAGNMTNKEIAILKNLTEKEVRDQIKSICKKRNLRTKKELVAHYKALFGSLSPESMMKEA